MENSKFVWYIRYKKQDGLLSPVSDMFIEGFQALTREPDGSPPFGFPPSSFFKRDRVLTRPPSDTPTIGLFFKECFRKARMKRKPT
ncbi:hypothetical protein AKJ65_04770 [candidate division MSBL1 archaeon SCGC-AAA259E19]|uniref:Uncharacterized protein n=1 Tax=candidate division MSBL1 archaeon SCGC-AAA259E19 TaxID=1698264 RepID=A0A133UJD3_9EURY|nr:hypothetical protein AKJ65_04770 [candidate division MSBL1 archaeon SCGC-AAA259E19]